MTTVAAPARDHTQGDQWSSAAEVRAAFTRFLMSYKFGVDEMMTKIGVLTQEFRHIHRYSPIEHVSSRLKSPESIIAKVRRRGCPMTLQAIRENITDIAGIRITCSFISDTYKIRDMLLRQEDITVVAIKDYIARPKPNGYTSLHLIVQIPIFMSDRVEPVCVEIQIRTIAMDFWASLEHKIYYKYDKAVPPALLAELKEAADAAHRLDVKMEHLHDQVTALNAGSETLDAAGAHDGGPSLGSHLDMDRLATRPLPEHLLDTLLDSPDILP